MQIIHFKSLVATDHTIEHVYCDAGRVHVIWWAGVHTGVAGPSVADEKVGGGGGSLLHHHADSTPWATVADGLSVEGGGSWTIYGLWRYSIVSKNKVVHTI